MLTCLSFRQPFAIIHSDEVFGTAGVDPVNLKSSLEECSWGKLTVVPGLDDPNEVATGVIEVSIGISLTDQSRGNIRNAVTTAVQNKLGHSLPGPYKYVLYSLEKCYVDCGWAAYASSIVGTVFIKVFITSVLECLSTR